MQILDIAAKQTKDKRIDLEQYIHQKIKVQ